MHEQPGYFPTLQAQLTMAGPTRPHRDFTVTIVDLLCVSPYYDVELVSALRAKGINAELAAIRFHLDKQLFNTHRIPHSPVLLDSASRIAGMHQSLRRVLKLLEYLANLIGLLRYFRLTRPALVHIQWLPLLEWVDLELWWIRKIKSLGIPIVLTVHNVLPHGTGEARKQSFAQLYELVDALICHTQASKATLVERFGIGASKIRVIAHGPIVRPTGSISVEEARKALQLDAALTVLVLGTIKAYKGLSNLLDAWKTVAAELPQARLVIAGQGSSKDTAHLRRLVESSALHQSVTLCLRSLTTAELELFHVAADVVALPYTAITQSGALMTAMGFEKAIVCSSLPAFREYLAEGEYGELVPPGDSQALARALLHLLRNAPHRTMLATRAGNAAHTEYSWKNIAGATVDLYAALGAFAAPR